MQKVKRKSGGGDVTEPKQKKVHFKNENQTVSDGPQKKNLVKPKKTFNKDGPKDKTGQGKVKFSKDKSGKEKFHKNRLGNDKKNFSKDGEKKNFSKDKFGKDKFPRKNLENDKKNFSKDGEKPKWSEMKKEKKQLRITRRKAKATAEVFEVSHKAKLLSAQIQRKVVKQEFRLNACKELHCLLKGQYKTIALTHDLSRVIQVLLKHSPDDIKNEISEELLDLMVQMAQSKYGQHAMKRILKYGTEFIRHEVIKRFFGHIVSLATHTISAPVLDYAYGEFATKKEKQHMQQEFYGEIYRNAKDDKVKTLSDVYKGSPEMKAAILQACKANIQKTLNKNLHDSELMHTVLYDYIRECNSEDRTEMISTLSPLIVPLSNSLPGVNAASICVWQGTNKDKKTILKVVKEHVVALSKHKTGYRLLLAIFDSVDDTVLVKKAIVSTIAANLKDIAKDHWGVMTLHWLVKPKDPATFHPTFIKFLEEGQKSGTSKKDAELRVSELRDAVLPGLKEDLEADAEYWLSSKANMLLVVAVLSIESSEAILEALAQVICKPEWKTSEDALSVEDAGIHMCLKKLASLDKDKQSPTLGQSICQHLTADIVKLWVPTNRGCFFLLKLIESNTEKVANKLRKKVQSSADLLKKQNTPGAKLLLQNLNQ